MNNASYAQLFKLAGPEVLITLAALAVLLVDLTVMRGAPARARRSLAVLLTGVGGFAAGLYLVRVPLQAVSWGGLWAVDPLTQLVKLGLVGLAVLTAMLSLEADYTDHVGEHFALLLLATVGLMVMAGAADLVLVFLGLELTGLSLYPLVALNKASPRATEAALKYFFFGALAAAVTLFGFSFLYGLSGTTNLAGIAAALRGRAFDPLLALAVVFSLVGFGFKVAAVPFHLWAPDAYQGAPTPVAAFIASGSKLAGFFLLGRFVALALPESGHAGRAALFTPGWVPAVAVLALASMVLGNLAALAQRDLKRLLAYSAIAHAGYLLLAVLALNGAANRPAALAALVYYAGTYALAGLGAFAVAGHVERHAGAAALGDLIGLGRRAPWLAGGLAVFLLSLAGLPPLAGFPAKFSVFAAVLNTPHAGAAPLGLVAAALLLSPVGFYYYLRVLKLAFVTESEKRPAVPAAPGNSPRDGGNRFGVETAVALLAAAGVLLLGLFPQWLLGPLQTAIRAAGG